MPRPTTAWSGAEALWITARGWARAAERRFGAAWIATPDGAWPAADLPRPPGGTSPRRRRFPPVPAFLRTPLKDLRLALTQPRFEVAAAGPWRDHQVRLVWEHHDLFNQAGRRLASAAGAPLVRYVHAPQVWEARKWGVRRPLWGQVLERGERRRLATADLVACVSAQVRDRLVDVGLAPERLLVSPMGVDVDRFSPRVDGAPVRRRHGIADDEVVIGWCGSFRPFHGLDRLLDAFGRAVRARAADGGPETPPVRLLLVGDGPLRARLEERARSADLSARVTFTGRVLHAEMPAHLAAMDVTVVSSSGAGGFHYSPLKAREYAACGRPVVAPREGEMTGPGAPPFLNLHRPGDPEDLARALLRLLRDSALRTEQGAQARRFAVARWTWQARLDDALEACRRLAATGRGEGA